MDTSSLFKRLNLHDVVKKCLEIVRKFSSVGYTPLSIHHYDGLITVEGHIIGPVEVFRDCYKARNNKRVRNSLPFPPHHIAPPQQC